MDFAFSEEQEMLRRSAREFLAKECSPKTVRKLMESEDGFDPAMWKKIADLGWTALGIPEQYGGVGTFLDLVVVLEEAGRALLPGPFFSTMGLAVPVLIEAGTEAQKKDALATIASGDARATLAFTEPSGRWDASSVTLTAKQSGGGWQLDGVKLFVPDAHTADYMAVAARSRGEGEEGITLFLVKGRPKGMSVKPLETLDMTRRWCGVRFEGVQLDADAVMGAPDKAWPRVRREAVSHKLADMLVLSESGRSATYYAAWAVDADAPDRSLASSMAKAYVSDAYRKVAGDGIQVHGGIGFTWEHDMHLYFKRAKSSEVTLGDATYHRELVAQALDL
ncbi:MAG: hypothetical protein AUI15_30795 [Actinobacteria bacterium 13_2_20CM_2_66_6]|nr:MAG: hypothetical protein AUI15_30795 [Actinobacteria bacterium 13_2_20CM_2_66_6]